MKQFQMFRSVASEAERSGTDEGSAAIDRTICSEWKPEDDILFLLAWDQNLTEQPRNVLSGWPPIIP